MAQRISVRTAPNGSTTTEARPLTKAEEARLNRLLSPDDGPGEAEYVSPARRRLRALQRGGAGPRIERVEIAGDPDPWFIKRGGLGELAAVAAWSPRDATGRLLIADDDPTTALVGFSAAALLIYVVSGEDDETPFFESYADAYEAADTRDDAEMAIVDALVNHICRINPRLVPDGEELSAEEKRAVAAQEKKSARAAKPKRDSSPPPTTRPPNGLNETVSSGAPA